MPAERSRSRYPPDLQQDASLLVWTDPLDPLSISNPASASCETGGISFASTITPTNYNWAGKSGTREAVADLDDGPGEVLEPSTVIFQVDDRQVPPRKVSPSSVASNSRKRHHPYPSPSTASSTHIPRPPNAFILFRSSFIRSQQISTEIETSHSTLSKIIGLTWRSLPEDEKQIWYDRAKLKMEEHRRMFPGYVFKAGNGGKRTSSTSSCRSASVSSTSPTDPFVQESINSSTVSDSTPLPKSKPKRRVREIAPHDPVRNSQIASLLLAGVKGADLEKRMREFDKSHVREVHHRFEEIIVKEETDERGAASAVKRKPSKLEVVIPPCPTPSSSSESPLGSPFLPYDSTLPSTPIETSLDLSLGEFTSQYHFSSMEMDSSFCEPQTAGFASVSYFVDPSQSYTDATNSFDFGLLSECPPNYPSSANSYEAPLPQCFGFDQYQPQPLHSFNTPQFAFGLGHPGIPISTVPATVPMTTAYGF